MISDIIFPRRDFLIELKKHFGLVLKKLSVLLKHLEILFNYKNINN